MKGDMSKQILNIALFIICPFLSLPILFCEIYNGKKYPLILMAIFMGCLSMFYFPFGDQFRYFYNLELARISSFDEKFNFDSVLIFKELNLINIFIYIAAKLNFTLELVRFVLIFISCLLLFNIYTDIRERSHFSYDKKKCIVAFIILLLSIPYYLINYGFRTGFGACLLAYGVYMIYVRHKLIFGLMFMFFATFTHYFFIIHSIIFTVLYFVRFQINRKTAVLVSIFLYIFSMSVFSLLYGKIEFIDAIMNSYVYGDEYGAGTYDWFSPKAKELWFNGIINTAVMFFIFFRLNKKGKFENVMYVLFILCIFTIPFATFFQRTIRSLVPILAIYLTMNFNEMIVYRARKIIIIFLIIAFIYPFWIYRVQYKYAKLPKIVYSSLPSLLTNHYDERTITKKVSIDGLWYD